MFLVQMALGNRAYYNVSTPSINGTAGEFRRIAKIG